MSSFRENSREPTYSDMQRTSVDMSNYWSEKNNKASPENQIEWFNFSVYKIYVVYFKTNFKYIKEVLDKFASKLGDARNYLNSDAIVVGYAILQDQERDPKKNITEILDFWFERYKSFSFTKEYEEKKQRSLTKADLYRYYRYLDKKFEMY